jgi:glycosyltransferase involved in cell wall biosynthesis
MYGLSAKAGGKTRVAIKRSHMFKMHDLFSMLVILEYDENLVETINIMKKLTIIDEHQEIINPYLYYAGVADSMLRYHRFGGKEFIDTSSFMYNTIYKTKIIHKDTSYSLLYFTQYNALYLEELFNTNDKCIQVKIFLSNTIITLKGRSAFFSRFFRDISIKQEKTIIIIDSEGAFRHISRFNRKNNKIYTVVNFHRNHFLPPFSIGSQIEPRHLRILNNFSKIDALVVLTQTQRQHIESQFKDIKNIFVIPNHITTQPAINQQIKKEDNLLVAVGRLEIHKNFAHLIDIFSEIIKSLPDARLEIWGKGSQQRMLADQIKRLNLENHVSLCGYTNNIEYVFSRARISLSTSSSEGFSLTVLESLSYGTPVISFNILGPRDIISNGINGFICDNDDMFIEKIIKSMTDNTLYSYLTEHTKNVFDKFSPKLVYNQWLNLFNTIEQARESDIITDLSDVSPLYSP